MESPTLAPTDAASILSEWRDAVRALLSDVSGWAGTQTAWKVQEYSVECSEELLGDYALQALKITTPRGELRLEPIARMVLGGRGTVEMKAWPALFRVRLVRRSDADEWVIRTDSGIALRQGWNRESFIQLANDLLDAE